jgi:hypothetical protein
MMVASKTTATIIPTPTNRIIESSGTANASVTTISGKAAA